MTTTVFEETQAEVLAALAEALPPEPPEEAETRTLADLNRRKQALAPEALQGDETAVAELAKVDAEIADVQRQRELRRLATAEQADRARLAAEQEAERQREDWRNRQAAHEDERRKALVRFEKHLAAMVASARTALIENGEGSVLQGKIEPGTALGYRKLNAEIENRILSVIRDTLGEFWIKPGVVIGDTGRTPLA